MTDYRNDSNEIGLRLKAAICSYAVGHKGVDRMLKQLRGKPISPGWQQLGMMILRDAFKNLDDGFIPTNFQDLVAKSAPRVG